MSNSNSSSLNFLWKINLINLPYYVEFWLLLSYNKNMKKSTVRHIKSFDIVETENELVFQVTGNGFLHHMVRIMVGTLMEVGRGERTPESIRKLFGAQRSEAGELIPSCGLCLMEVTY